MGKNSSACPDGVDGLNSFISVLGTAAFHDSFLLNIGNKCVCGVAGRCREQLLAQYYAKCFLTGTGGELYCYTVCLKVPVQSGMGAYIP